MEQRLFLRKLEAIEKELTTVKLIIRSQRRKTIPFKEIFKSMKITWRDIGTQRSPCLSRLYGEPQEILSLFQGFLRFYNDVIHLRDNKTVHALDDDLIELFF